MKRQQLRLMPLVSPEEFRRVMLLDNLTLGELLQQAPALSAEPIDASALRLVAADRFFISLLEPSSTIPLYRPPGLVLKGPGIAEATRVPRAAPAVAPAAVPTPTAPASAETAAPAAADMPSDVSEEQAVRLAYSREIDVAASFLRSGLSVLVVCDKLVVEHLWRTMAQRARLRPQLLEVPDEDDAGMMPRSLRQRQLARLKALIRALIKGDVLVIRHLDLLAGGGDTNMPTESRELIELVYESSDRLLLAFADRSMEIPEVLAARFAVRLSISGLPRNVELADGEEKPIGAALVTADEASKFINFSPENLYKNIAGMNPVRLRHAIKYAVQEEAGNNPVPVSRLYLAIRAFKAQTSANFEVPDVTFRNIGGYDEVKAEILRAIRLIDGASDLEDEKLRRELIPRGFLLHGPPGTGKTLFAKAIANHLTATIQIVSGPEVTDMYVGESERKVREYFAEARRNAPAVLVFDEFDSIATKRSGREDGGARAGNAIVAQILTEMDGFRPDVPMLVIGTTNRLDIIDEALLRPSRFRAIKIDLPNATARRAIAEVHAAHFGIGVSPHLLDVVARATEGFNGDEIRFLFREARVGMMEKPPVPADAYRIGRLVGMIRRAAEERQSASASQRRSALDTRTRRNQQPVPSGPMTTIDTSQSEPNEGVTL